MPPNRKNQIQQHKNLYEAAHVGLFLLKDVEIMSDIYEDLGHLMGELDFGESLLETMILNGKMKKLIDIFEKLRWRSGMPCRIYQMHCSR